MCVCVSLLLLFKISSIIMYDVVDISRVTFYDSDDKLKVSVKQVNDQFVQSLRPSHFNNKNRHIFMNWQNNKYNIDLEDRHRFYAPILRCYTSNVCLYVMLLLLSFQCKREKLRFQLFSDSLVHETERKESAIGRQCELFNVNFLLIRLLVSGEWLFNFALIRFR